MTATDSPAPNLQRVALVLEYDGTAYCGWQIQPHAPSVQQSLNEAISRVADEQVACIGAGRTDTGVHASGQVVHFDASVYRERRSWLLGINSNLPDDISVLDVRPVSDAFHARYSAIGRTYRYVILNRSVRSALLRHRAWWVRSALDVRAMREASRCLHGTHDFSSFRAAGCQAHTAVRTIRRLDIEIVDQVTDGAAHAGDLLVVTCEADAFPHHMVRNIVGSLVRIGTGEEDAGWLEQVLTKRDRRVAGITAPACGLTLTRVDYPEPFGFVTMDSSNSVGD